MPSVLAAIKAFTAAGSGASTELTAAMLSESRDLRSIALAEACETARLPTGVTSATDICMNRR